MSDDDELSERIALAASRGMVRRIDEWRRRQPELIPRATAIRRLIEASLARDAPAPGAAKPKAAAAKKAPAKRKGKT